MGKLNIILHLFKFKEKVKPRMERLYSEEEICWVRARLG